MQSFRIHHVNFYKPEANAIHCLSYDVDTYSLALSRSDNSIEVWDLKNAPFQRQVFPCYQGYSVESLAWCGSRLFCTGLSAYIQEYSSSSLFPKSSTPVSGGPTWCIAVNKDRTRLAAGTEDGYICLFIVTDEGIEFERNFDNQEGRILCLAWHESGQTIVSGSTDIIRIWNVATGYAVDRILVGRIDRKTETTIWCLSILGDGTIISGDSYGRTSFWDSKTGTLISAARDHKADVLALCVSEDERSVYTSGVDPLIIKYTQVCLQPSKSSETVWVKSAQFRGHTHDVRALTLAGSCLVSGGVDAYLVLNQEFPKLFLRYPPLLQSSAVHIASRARCLLLQYSKTLEIWKLGSSKKVDKERNGEMLPLSSDVKKALQLSVKDGERIVCSAVSKDARWFAYSTLECLRLFYFTLEDDAASQVSNATLQKVKNFPAESRSATCMCFTSSGDRLIVASGEKISILSTNLIQPSLLHVFSDNAGNVVHHLCSSQTDKYVAAADLTGKVTVYNLLDYSVHCSLPHHHCLSTAMVFHPRSGNLFVAYSDQMIVEYDLTRKAYTPWTRKLMQYQDPFLNPYSPVLRITFGHGNTIIFHDDDTMYSVRMDELLPSTVKRPRHQQREEDPICNSDVAVNSSQRYKHLLALSQLDDDELIAVEVLPGEIFKQLPPALKRKKFGT